MAKTVVVKLDGKMAMAVLPASHQVDFERLKRASGAQDAVLATEKEFKDLFPGCDIGAMPPFGNHLGSYFCWQQQWASDFPKGSKFNYPATKSLA
jgi:Ala-tRNA(Pro) deacylase